MRQRHNRTEKSRQGKHSCLKPVLYSHSGLLVLKFEEIFLRNNKFNAFWHQHNVSGSLISIHISWNDKKKLEWNTSNRLQFPKCEKEQWNISFSISIQNSNVQWYFNDMDERTSFNDRHRHTKKKWSFEFSPFY